MSFHIAVPSRARCKGFYLQTYRKLLWRYGLEDRTTVFVQTDQDMREYTDAFPRLRVVLREGTGQAAAQAAIGAYYAPGTRVVVLHDDVTRVARYRDGRSRRFDDVRRLFEAAFAVMEAYGLTLGGLACNDNALNELGVKALTLGLRFVYDPVHFEIIGGGALPLVTQTKNDYERSIWHYRRSGGVLRVVAYGASTRHIPKTSAADEEADLAAFRATYAQELQSFARRGHGYYALRLKPLPYRSDALGEAAAEAGALRLFLDVLGDFDVMPDLTLPGGRLLDLLMRMKMPLNDQRTAVVPPERRVVVRSRSGREAVRADAPVHSESYYQGAVYEACMAVLPESMRFSFVTVNRNLQCHEHRDVGNVGPSLVLFLGRFQGGALVFAGGRRVEQVGVLHAFDGSETHWNEPIGGGVKYSVVFYNRRSCELRPGAHHVAALAPVDGLDGGLEAEARRDAAIRACDGVAVPFV